MDPSENFTFILLLDVRQDKIMKEQDDLCIHGNKDVILKLCHKTTLHHRVGLCKSGQ